MKLKKGDNVKVIAGKDKGKTGKIIKIDPVNMRVIVHGVNVYKKHRRPRKQGEKGEIVNVPRSMNASNVLYLCGNCGRAARLGAKFQGESKVRFCKKCGSSV